MSRLDRVRVLLQEGRRHSKQLSFGRRQPAPDSLEFFKKARTELISILSSESTNIDALRLLAQTEESLLNYRAAAIYLETAMDIGGTHNRKDIKKLSLYLQEDRQWKELGLTPRELLRLGEFLRLKVETVPAPDDLRWTETWLETHYPDRKQPVIEALRRRGASSDLQVLRNVVSS